MKGPRNRRCQCNALAPLHVSALWQSRLAHESDAARKARVTAKGQRAGCVGILAARLPAGG